MGFFEKLFSMGRGGGEHAVDELSPAEKTLRAELSSFKDNEATANELRRYFLRWTGSVQAVGFRWTHQRYANMRNMTGWVMNLDDGSVEMEIQGTPLLILAHLEKIHSDYARLNNFIWVDRVESRDVIADEESFEVLVDGEAFRF